MTVIGTAKDINDVIHFFRTDYPEQNFDLAAERSGVCNYILNGVSVDVCILHERPLEEIKFEQEVKNYGESSEGSSI